MEPSAAATTTTTTTTTTTPSKRYKSWSYSGPARPCLKREGHKPIFSKGGSCRNLPVVDRQVSFQDALSLEARSTHNATMPIRKSSIDNSLAANWDLNSSEHCKRNSYKRSSLHGQTQIVPKGSSSHSKPSKRLKGGREHAASTELSKSSHSKSKSKSKKTATIEDDLRASSSHSKCRSKHVKSPRGGLSQSLHCYEPRKSIAQKKRSKSAKLERSRSTQSKGSKSGLHDVSADTMKRCRAELRSFLTQVGLLAG